MSARKIALQTLIALAVSVTVPFLIAGRWDLPMVWGFLLLTWLVVFRRDPALLKERRESGPGAEQWDRIWLRIYSLFLFGTLIVALLDVGRLHWSDSVPLWLQIVGLVGFVAALAFAGWAVATNTFFSEVVRIQRDRGHYVVQDGPYRFVRHPGYLGNILAWPCAAVTLGSWAALLLAGVVVGLYIWRTAREDRTLRAGLEGYGDYARKVRYRLLPGVW
jgi:protein-S-isoprenylcysteine O-methyltransferase Ste14